MAAILDRRIMSPVAMLVLAIVTVPDARVPVPQKSVTAPWWMPRNFAAPLIRMLPAEVIVELLAIAPVIVIPADPAWMVVAAAPVVLPRVNRCAAAPVAMLTAPALVAPAASMLTVCVPAVAAPFMILRVVLAPGVVPFRILTVWAPVADVPEATFNVCVDAATPSRISTVRAPVEVPTEIRPVWVTAPTVIIWAALPPRPIPRVEVDPPMMVTFPPAALPILVTCAAAPVPILVVPIVVEAAEPKMLATKVPPVAVPLKRLNVQVPDAIAPLKTETLSVAPAMTPLNTWKFWEPVVLAPPRN